MRGWLLTDEKTMATRVPDGRGFDVVVWQKVKIGEVYCAAYSPRGQEYVSKWIEGPVRRVQAYEMGAIHPKEFIGEAPKDLRIGGISPGAKVPMLINPPLH